MTEPAPRRLFLALPALAVLLAAPFAARAQEAPADHYYDLETKYIFGFTNGTDIGAEGERELEVETTAAFVRRGGQYNAFEQEFEWEQTPSQFWTYEASVHFLSQQINGVPGLKNYDGTNFSGLSFKPKYLIIGRGPGDPFGVSISVQPEWERVDGTSGQQTETFSLETVLAVDTELIPNRAYGAINLIYGPEIGRVLRDPAWSRASTYGATAAAAYRVSPKVTLGGEIQYYRAYDSYNIQDFTGYALYLGPTLHIQFTPKIFLAGAWSMEVAGHAAGGTGRLDLTDFERQVANLKVGWEF